MKGCKKFAKKCFIDLAGNEKSSTFAPAIERDAAVIEILKTKERKHELPLKKNFLKFFFRKVLVVQKKSLPLHPLSKR